VIESLPSRPDVSLRLPARAENVAIVRQALTGVGEALGLDARTLGDVKLAATEACTNVVVHAYQGIQAEPWLEVEAYTAPGALVIVVRDGGTGMEPRAAERGMEPRAESERLGLGLPLIGALADSTEIGSGPDGRGTQVAMTFSLGDTAGEAGRDE